MWDILGLGPAPRQLVEQFLVQSLVRIFVPHAENEQFIEELEDRTKPEEDVPPDELMDNLTLCRDALEDDVLLAPQLDHHVPSLPVHIPGLLVKLSIYSAYFVP